MISMIFLPLRSARQGVESSAAMRSCFAASSALAAASAAPGCSNLKPWAPAGPGGQQDQRGEHRERGRSVRMANSCERTNERVLGCAREG